MTESMNICVDELMKEIYTFIAIAEFENFQKRENPLRLYGYGSSLTEALLGLKRKDVL